LAPLPSILTEVSDGLSHSFLAKSHGLCKMRISSKVLWRTPVQNRHLKHKRYRLEDNIKVELIEVYSVVAGVKWIKLLRITSSGGLLC
jgi:hypothetical protein